VYGEGPTQVLEGHFTDTKRAGYTGQDVRFTSRGRSLLYAILLGWPGEIATVRSLGADLRLCERPVREVRLLGCRHRLEWERRPEGLRVRLPAKPPCDHAYALKITL